MIKNQYLNFDVEKTVPQDLTVKNHSNPSADDMPVDSGMAVDSAAKPCHTEI